MSQMYHHGLILPVLALAGWTFVMWLWLYATRIPAMRKARANLEEMRRTGAKPNVPAEVARVADNYNHLHEQPTIFYAVALAAEIARANDPVNIGLAWAYVAIRIVHSLVQATANIIMIRFYVFCLASIALLALLARTLWLVLG
jgi:hypothetical protein